MKPFIHFTFLFALFGINLCALFQTPCDRYICLSQPNSQDALDLSYTGIQSNHGVCVWKVGQSSGTNSNYYLQECMYPMYQCTQGTVASDPNSVGICVLQSPYQSQDQTATQNQQNGLYDGEWCLSNQDCASGLCDGVSNQALLQVPLSTQYKVIQNRTNKCYVRHAGDACAISNNYRYHQQCEKGLRCARNDSTTYTCQATLAIGANCTVNTVYNNTGGSNTWELCAFGSDCIQTNGSTVFTCQAWFSLGDATSFNYIGTFVNNDYVLSQTIFNAIDGLGSWIGQGNRMCNSTVAGTSTVAGYLYACQTAQTTQQDFGTVCGNDTYCQGQQLAGNPNPQCSCSFFNQDGNAYCRGFVGNTNWFQTSANQTWGQYFNNQSTFNSCYPYEIWNQFAQTNQTQCNIPVFTFADPAPNRTKGNCYDTIGYPSTITRPTTISYWQNTIITQSTQIPNFPITASYSFLPSAYWFNYLPNKQPGNNIGQCPQFLCEQIWVELPVLTAASTTSTKIQAKKGACAYYDELSNIWSIQECRSPYDFCQVCLAAPGNAYLASSGVTTTSEANIQMCGGYSVTQLAQSSFSAGSVLPKAWKCQRTDGTLKRVFDYCWDNFDCLSGLCDSTGECTVLQLGQICQLTIQCDKNLVCAFFNSTDNTLTCQPAIPAGQACTIDTYSRCKIGSKCIKINGESGALCTNYFSLPGFTIFSFYDTRMPNYASQSQIGGIQGIEGIPTNLQGAYNMMCATGSYSNSVDNTQLFVDYVGCLHFTKTTRGGWPKECFGNTYDCQSVQSFNFIRNNYDSSKTVTLDGVCNCAPLNGLFTSASNAYGLYNQGGLGYCQGFPGENDNSLFVMRRTYEQDFVNCYPYEILRNTAQLKPYQGWLAIGGECGYLPLIKYNPMPLKPFPKCYRNIFMQRSLAWNDVGTLYYLWRRCPQYACVTTLDASICRYYNESTQIISLQACANGQACNQFNGTYYLCGYTTPILKEIGENCFFDIECKTQICGARDAEGNPNYNVPNRQCTTIPNGQVCQVHQNCINGSRCVPQLNSSATTYNGTYNYTVQSNNSYGSVCMTVLQNGDTCQITMPDQCKFGSQCILIYNAANYTCVNYYSLPNGTKIQQPSITNIAAYTDAKTESGTLGQLAQLCTSGYYYLDQWFTPQGVMQITGNSGCATRTLGTFTASFNGFPHPCQQDIDCNSTYAQGNATRYQYKQSDIGVCNCSYWNNWGYGFCNAFESDDTVFLNAASTFYQQNFNSCYPYQYLDQYTVNNSTNVTGCFIPNWNNWHSNIYITTNTTDASNHSYYATSWANSCYQQVSMSLSSGTYQIQLPSQNQTYPNFCPQYSCSGTTYNISSDGIDWAICRHYSTNQNSFWLIRACTDANNVCTQYNETLWLCQRADGKLKGVGETCFNGGQCMSQICDLGISPTAGKCNVHNLSEPCVVHENCDMNLRCAYFTWQQKELMSGSTKFCQQAIPANAICTPLTADLCRYGSTCALINNQPTPICIPWYSLPSGTNVTIISNYSLYPQVNYFSTLQTLYSELCQSGLYDPSFGCLPSQEVTAQGWPSTCATDADCVGLYYGTPGSCNCDNKNQDGSGYCTGFDGEANNKTQTWFLSYQRQFVNCYPYQIDNVWSVDGDCNYTNYSTYDSAPFDSLGLCYPAVGIQGKISNITKIVASNKIERVIYTSGMIMSVFSVLVLTLLMLF